MVLKVFLKDVQDFIKQVKGIGVLWVDERVVEVKVVWFQGIVCIWGMGMFRC